MQVNMNTPNFGAKIKIENGYVHAKANKLIGADVYLDIPSGFGRQLLSEKGSQLAVFVDGTQPTEESTQLVPPVEVEIPELEEQLEITSQEIDDLARDEFYEQYADPEALAERRQLDIDKFEELAFEYRIMSVPTMIFFKDGEKKEELIGFRDEDELLEVINSLK